MPGPVHPQRQLGELPETRLQPQPLPATVKEKVQSVECRVRRGRMGKRVIRGTRINLLVFLVFSSEQM